MPNYYTGEHRAKEHAFSFLKKRPIRLNLKKSFLFRANRWLVRNVGYDILAFLRTFISQINEVGFPSRLVTQFFTSNPFNFVFLPFFFFPLLVKMSDKKYRAKTHLTWAQSRRHSYMLVGEEESLNMSFLQTEGTKELTLKNKTWTKKCNSFKMCPEQKFFFSCVDDLSTFSRTQLNLTPKELFSVVVFFFILSTD